MEETDVMERSCAVARGKDINRGEAPRRGLLCHPCAAWLRASGAAFWPRLLP
jgi:hypothetical protein